MPVVCWGPASHKEFGGRAGAWAQALPLEMPSRLGSQPPRSSLWKLSVPLLQVPHTECFCFSAEMPSAVWSDAGTTVR